MAYIQVHAAEGQIPCKGLKPSADRHALIVSVRAAEGQIPCNSILKFFQVDITGMFRMTSSARYFKDKVGSSRPN